MANLAQNNSPKPLSAPGGSVNLSSGVAPGMTLHKLMIAFTVTGNLQITTLDGNTTTAIAMPVTNIPFVIDCQFQSVTWTGTAVAIGFYRIDG